MTTNTSSVVECNTRNLSALELVNSSAMRAFCTALDNRETVEMAVLRAENARNLANLEDLKNGLPQLAAGEFVSPVWEDWQGLFGEQSSNHVEYVSGSGTRYLMWKDNVLADCLPSTLARSGSFPNRFFHDSGIKKKS